MSSQRTAQSSIDLSKMTGSDQAKLTGALLIIEKHLSEISLHWRTFSDEKKAKILAHSPILAKIYYLTEFMRNG